MPPWPVITASVPDAPRPAWPLVPDCPPLSYPCATLCRPQGVWDFIEDYVDADRRHALQETPLLRPYFLNFLARTLDPPPRSETVEAQLDVMHGYELLGLLEHWRCLSVKNGLQDLQTYLEKLRAADAEGAAELPTGDGSKAEHKRERPEPHPEEPPLKRPRRTEGAESSSSSSNVCATPSESSAAALVDRVGLDTGVGPFPEGVLGGAVVKTVGSGDSRERGGCLVVTKQLHYCAGASRGRHHPHGICLLLKSLSSPPVWISIFVPWSETHCRRAIA